MKIETISVMERKNLGNYEHIEMSASARVEDGEDAYSAMLTLKTLVNAALLGKAQEAKGNTNGKGSGELLKDNTDDDRNSEKEQAKEEDSSDKKRKKGTKKTKEVEEPMAEVPPVIEAEAVKEEKPKSKSIPYDRSKDAHKNLLSSHLTKNFPSWKSYMTNEEKEEIIAFTSSLEGKDFLDTDGNIVESFQKVLRGFFNA